MIRKSLVVAAFGAAMALSMPSTAQLRAGDIKNKSEDYTECGVIAGANFQQLVAFPFLPDYSVGPNIGGYASYHGNTYGIRIELTGSFANYKTEFPASHSFVRTNKVASDTVTKGDLTAYYVTVPVLLEIRPVKHLRVLMGGAYTHLLSVNDNNGSLSKCMDSKTIFKTGNVSMVMGMDIDLTKSFRLGGTYSMGFSDVNNQKFNPLSDKWSLLSGQVYLTYQVKKWYHVHH